jgi:hypothetical protein
LFAERKDIRIHIIKEINYSERRKAERRNEENIYLHFFLQADTF